jgi:hypothetical protein
MAALAEVMTGSSGILLPMDANAELALQHEKVGCNLGDPVVAGAADTEA